MVPRENGVLFTSALFLFVLRTVMIGARIQAQKLDQHYRFILVFFICLDPQ